MQIKCEFCGRDVNPKATGVYQLTMGWVMYRAGGGGHGVSLPKRAPRWAHGNCIDREGKGHQADIFEMPTNARYDEEGHLIHEKCAVCGKDAPFGSDVALMKGQLGTWFCFEHWGTRRALEGK